GAFSWRAADSAPAASRNRNERRAASDIAASGPALLLQQDEVALQVADDLREVLILVAREVPARLLAQHHQVVDDSLRVPEIGLALVRERVLDHTQRDQRLVGELLDQQREVAARQGLVLGRALRTRIGARLAHASVSIGTRSGLP